MALSRDNSVVSVTASTTQTQAAAISGGKFVGGDINLVTVGNASDAVVMPANLPKGTVTIIVNLSANAGLLFPAVGGAGNGGSANASVALAASKTTVALSIDNANNFRTFVSA